MSRLETNEFDCCSRCLLSCLINQCVCQSSPFGGGGLFPPKCCTQYSYNALPLPSHPSFLCAHFPTLNLSQLYTFVVFPQLGVRSTCLYSVRCEPQTIIGDQVIRMHRISVISLYSQNYVFCVGKTLKICPPRQSIFAPPPDVFDTHSASPDNMQSDDAAVYRFGCMHCKQTRQFQWQLGFEVGEATRVCCNFKNSLLMVTKVLKAYYHKLLSSQKSKNGAIVFSIVTTPVSQQNHGFLVKTNLWLTQAPSKICGLAYMELH